MLVDYSRVQHIFIVCGRTDMRRGKTDRFKALYFDQDGFLLLYKVVESGRLQWPRNQDEVRQLTSQELRWLLEGLSIQQPKAITPATPSYLT